jgi:pristinamycin I synthase-3/4
MVGAPDSAHDARSWLSPAEMHQVLREYNDMAVRFAGKACLHHDIERQAAWTPDAVAVVSEASALSYSELGARAGCLVHTLRPLGMGPDVVVGICAERSLDLMVGLLAILKAGGAFLPLDPSYPPERLALMAEEGLAGRGRPVLLVQRRLAPLCAGWSARAGLQEVEFDGPWELEGEEVTWSTAEEMASGNLAYVIYTSGSTGRPKG